MRSVYRLSQSHIKWKRGVSVLVVLIAAGYSTSLCNLCELKRCAHVRKSMRLHRCYFYWLLGVFGGFYFDFVFWDFVHLVVEVVLYKVPLGNDIIHPVGCSYYSIK